MCGEKLGQNITVGSISCFSCFVLLCSCFCRYVLLFYISHLVQSDFLFIKQCFLTHFVYCLCWCYIYKKNKFNLCFRDKSFVDVKLHALISDLIYPPLWWYIFIVTGKTYTMLGTDRSGQTLGAMPCAIAWLFKLINEQKDKTGARFSVRVSAVEVTGKNETLRDLLVDIAHGKSLVLKGWSTQ